MQRFSEIVTSVFVVGALITACATSTDDSGTDNGATVQDAGPAKIVVDAGPSTTTTQDSGSTNTKTCVANCKTDSECQTSCPAAPNGGLNCCDTTSGVCYASSSSTCGTGTTSDSGTPTY